MILGALVVGALTAYYFGMRAGAVAAAVAAALFLAALFLPGKALLLYGAVALGVGGVLLVGPRMPGRERNRADLVSLGRRLLRRGLKLMNRYKDQGKK